MASPSRSARREVEHAFRRREQASDARRGQPRVSRHADQHARRARATSPRGRARTDPGVRRPPMRGGPHAWPSSRPPSTQRRGRNWRRLQGQLEEIAAQFDDLTRNQKILGFTESDGIRDRMTKSAAAVERIIHEDMSWMSEGDAHKLLISLLTMRRYESRIPADPLDADANRVLRRVQEIQDAAWTTRRRRRHEGAARRSR